MFVTQDYKKATCCNANCRQGRNCPRRFDAESLIVNGLCAVACVVVLAAPVALWLLGYGGL